MTPSAAEDRLLPGEIVDGRYRVDELLGHGGVGVIHRAFDVDLERTCALELLSGALGVGAREQLRREAKALASLRSDHVASVYAFGEHRGRPFFAMEFVLGVRAVVDKPFEFAKLVEIVRRVASRRGWVRPLEEASP